MENDSESLQKLLESFGIKNDDPILKEVSSEENDMHYFRDETDSKEEEEWCDSLNFDDLDILKYGSTPPRTERSRKQKERNAYCDQAVSAAKDFTNKSKHKMASRCTSMPIPSQSLSAHEHQFGSPNAFRQRKRSQDKQRSYDRQCKFMIDELSNEFNSMTPAFVNDVENEEEFSKCESLPPVALAVKVPQRSRYLSLSFKKVRHGRELVKSPRKNSITDIPADRLAFFSHISGVLKNNTQEQEQIIYNSPRSEEDVLYQQELSEMIWLELQAWHAGKDTVEYDSYLLEQRERVKSVYEEVMNFNINNNSNYKSEETDFHWVFPECAGCLSVWCSRCIEKESEALEKVWHLLEKISEIEALFPSTRKLCLYFPEWKEEEFVMKYKSLSLWFNTTSQLRFVIELLGRRLGHMTSDLIPWPTFPNLKLDFKYSVMSVESKDSGNHSMLIEESDNQTNFTPVGLQVKNAIYDKIENREASKVAQVPIVRFEIQDLDEASIESSDPSHSSESDLTSTSSNSARNRAKGVEENLESDNDAISPRIDHLSPPPSQGLKRCTSDIFLEANPYRTYVEKLLRNKGMKKTLDKVAEVIRDAMSQTICIIEESHTVPDDKEATFRIDSDGPNIHPSALSALQEELRRHSNWTKNFECLSLPRFHTLFLFLASVPLHMMMECLKLRLEQMPAKPSRMSIKQLMREYKEGVKFAVAIRHKYVKWCRVLVPDLPPLLANNLEARKCQAIEELDSNIKKMIEVYLEWLEQFILMLHKETHVAGLQRNFLQEEWRFVQSTCSHVTDGECLAATRFCNIACHMLCSISDFLDTGLDEMITDFQDSALDEALDDDDSYEMDEAQDFEDDEEISTEEYERRMQRRKLFQRCRSIQELVSEARERALRAIALAKMLKKDLEVATEVKQLPKMKEMFDILCSMNHALIKGHSLQNLLIFVPENLENCPEEILTLMQMRMGAASSVTDFFPWKYLILINKPPGEHDLKWPGKTVYLALNAESAIALSRIQVTGLMLIVKDGCHLQQVRRQLSDHMKGEFSYEQIAPHKAVTESLHDMKAEALQLCKGLEKSISHIKNLIDIDNFFPNADDDCRKLVHLTRDTIHQGFIFGFEYHKEVVRLVSGIQRFKLIPMLTSFGRLWIKFVKSHYSSGRGRRPRWASPGLEFLSLICEPYNTSRLSDLDFKNLQNEIENCMEYIMGSSSNSDSSAPSTPLLMPRTFRPQRSISSTFSHQSSLVESPSSATDSPRIRNSALLRSNQPSFEKCDEIDFSTKRKIPMESVRENIAKLDRYLEEKRKKDTPKLVGRVCEHRREFIEIKQHRVSFSWHRGFKIGAGQFAKVYTAINSNSGELMAMKVLPLQPNNHKLSKRVAHELSIFEKIDHPHLVKYYGVEIHNDEMLMFMEYCDEGTLEALSRNTEGLPEEIVRKYTRQLLSAVHRLHENGIVHRDIKGANIFLAQEGNILKLGDFGCAVRLHNLQTVAGELSGVFGTYAYMAPEIFQSDKGYGRAADIWSLACVVIEMVTGKRPWPQYDSSVQIMYKVGSGLSPPIPEALQEEGCDFLNMCFVHDPKKRATSAKLLDHTFVKVEEEENASLPLFSLLPFGLKKNRDGS